jgi:NAD(P)-dependent dehydrogenase (short-subunit alcohol dehydrogenase family)
MTNSRIRRGRIRVGLLSCTCSAVRAGVAGLAKGLSFELASDGFLVNTLGPGRIFTEGDKYETNRATVSRCADQRRDRLAIRVGGSWLDVAFLRRIAFADRYGIACTRPPSTCREIPVI